MEYALQILTHPGTTQHIRYCISNTVMDNKNISDLIRLIASYQSNSSTYNTSSSSSSSKHGGTIATTRSCLQNEQQLEKQIHAQDKLLLRLILDHDSMQRRYDQKSKHLAQLKRKFQSLVEKQKQDCHNIKLSEVLEDEEVVNEIKTEDVESSVFDITTLLHGRELSENFGMEDEVQASHHVMGLRHLADKRGQDETMEEDEHGEESVDTMHVVPGDCCIYLNEDEQIQHLLYLRTKYKIHSDLIEERLNELREQLDNAKHYKHFLLENVKRLRETLKNVRFKLFDLKISDAVFGQENRDRAKVDCKVHKKKCNNKGKRKLKEQEGKKEKV